MIDIETIGAGGGSIVSRTRLVSCISARKARARTWADLYARGGTLPTITDANVLLGHLDIHEVLPDAPDAGPTVRSAFEKLGEGLGTTAEGAADAATESST